MEARVLSKCSDVSADRSRMQDNNLVLVVDDDPGMLKAVQRLLRAHAYEPILFSSARAFKNHSDVDKAVCIILDINLPDGSGIELRKDLTAAGVYIPVIFITGNANPKVREAALASGCLAFLTKPFSMHDLIEPLREASAGKA
jgi:FixJ family two-component response regulator